MKKQNNIKEFNRVIGYEDIKLELYRIIDSLNNPEKYKAIGARTPKGLLLTGVPGTGKTTMAECFIKASKRKPFVLRKDLHDGDFIDKIRETFAKAKADKKNGSILLLDDLDKFSAVNMEEFDSEEFVTVQTCLDECDDNVFVIATVNNIRKLPKSLLRNGRFDKRIHFDCPNQKDAEKVIEHYLKNKKCSKDVNCYDLSQLLDGYSCATLETVLNEAAIYAAYEGKKEIGMNHLVKAYLREVEDAPEQLDSKNKQAIYRVAVHEASHCLVSELLEDNGTCFVSVRPHDGSVGGFSKSSTNDNYWTDIKHMQSRVITLLAGKAGTEVVFGTTDVGCTDDLNRAYDIVGRFYDDYAINGFNTRRGGTVPKYESKSTYAGVERDVLVNNQIERFYEEAKKIIIENRSFLDALTKELVEKEVLVSSDIQRIKATSLKHKGEHSSNGQQY